MLFKKSDSDETLVRHLNKGSERAFKIIFDRYWEYVFSICYKGVQSHEDAKELTQEIFKSIWERRAKIKASDALQHYLARAAKFQVYNYYRNQKISKKHFDKFFSDFQEAENYTENEVFYRDLKDQIHGMLDRLPGQCKTVFHLSREDNLSHQQIAKKLNISIKTVEYHICNARKQLAKELRLYF